MAFRLDSEVMGSKREVNVRLPPSYQGGNVRYSVLNVVDGGVIQNFHHIRGLTQPATIHASYDELIVVG